MVGAMGFLGLTLAIIGCKCGRVPVARHAKEIGIRIPSAPDAMY
jgi:hypothetical protein